MNDYLIKESFWTLVKSHKVNKSFLKPHFCLKLSRMLMMLLMTVSPASSWDCLTLLMDSDSDAASRVCWQTLSSWAPPLSGLAQSRNSFWGHSCCRNGEVTSSNHCPHLLLFVELSWWSSLPQLLCTSIFCQSKSRFTIPISLLYSKLIALLLPQINNFINFFLFTQQYWMN